jgi:transposase
MDLGDRTHTVCVLDPAGNVLVKERIANDRAALGVLAERWRGALFVCEVGTHSPWISRFLEGLGCRLVIANPRKVRAIFETENKSDDRDAEQLARIARVDLALLHPVEHGSEAAQRDLLSIRLRDNLVRSRVQLINAVRFSLKSLGYRVCNPASERFHSRVLAEVPAECLEAVRPLLDVLEVISAKIAEAERTIARLARERYPVASRLQQIDGVGPVTALCFVLKVGDPGRFERLRDIGAYLGLTPRRDQSGSCDKQLGITKCGDTYLRRLLVNCASYILGPFGPESALRRFGQTLTGPTVRGKKRAATAVARKLAVLMLSLWKTGLPYERRAPQAAEPSAPSPALSPMTAAAA